MVQTLNKSKEYMKFIPSLLKAREFLAPHYETVANKKFSMYQIPRGEVIGIEYVPSISYQGKLLTFIDINGKKLDIKLGAKKEQILIDVVTGVDKNYTKLTYVDEEDISGVVPKVTFWFISGGGNNFNAQTDLDYLEPFMVLIGVNWDGKWLRPEQHRTPNMPKMRLEAINKERFFYLSQFGKPGEFDLNYPNLGELEIQNYLLLNKISNVVSGSKAAVTSAGYAVLCIPEAPFLFQRPESWFCINHTSTLYFNNGNSRSKTARTTGNEKI